MIATEPRRDGVPFVGRDEELEFLERLTAAPLPSITFVHGIGGIGKSRVLEDLAWRRRAAGATVLRIDCQSVEPTTAGFLRELSRAAGGDFASCEDASRRLGELGSVLLLLDDVDALRLLDTWLRRTFVPALPASSMHVVFSGRAAPLSAWVQMPWRGAFRVLELEPLDDGAAVTLLTAGGIEQAQAERINRIARGHPLALTLAALTLRSISDDHELEQVAFHRIADELARRCLGEISDPLTRRAVEAAAVVRRVTEPLLGAMLPDVAPSDAYERLRALPLMRLARDGLQLHDTVRDAIAFEVRSADPERYLTLRRACWAHLTRELRTAPPSELWRYSGDLLYLLENPVVREAFFPSGAQRYAVETARAADEAAILAIAEEHDGPLAARATAAWLKHSPESFRVARERNGEVVGYYVLFESARLDATIASQDPVLAQWAAHLAKNPVEPGERVLFLRRWLSREGGEAPSAVQGVCWLDIKSAYMVHRPHLRRVYLTVRDVGPYAAAATRLGFTVLDPCATKVAGEQYVTAMLDFGPNSVDGWFAKLVADELGIATSSLLDVGGRELVVGSRRAPLTRREFDLFYYLVQHAGNVVHREDLLADVWRDGSDVASNVVDVAVRSLRKKLGDRANVIETISGIGYRLRDDEAAEH
jgi:hypothetical protein